MSRPLYEGAHDRTNEQAVAAKLAGLWGCEAVKLPMSYELDFAFVRDGIVASFVEVKCRAYSWAQINQWGGYMLALSKWERALSLFQTSGRPFTLAVHTPDGIYFKVCREFGFAPVKIGGRRDRGDWQDIEPVVMLPTGLFTRACDPILERAA